jgi:hypothetical protein
VTLAARLLGWAGPSARPPRAQPPWRLAVPVGLVGLAVGGVWLLAILAANGFDATKPFWVGSRWRTGEALVRRGVAVSVRPGIGYDGQWYLGLAEDPLLRGGLAATFDRPRYRAGRPLYAWTGWLLAAGRPRRIPLALLAAGALGMGLGAAATGRLLAAFGRSRWLGLGFCLLPGVVVGVVVGTAEPLGLALAVLGLSLVLDGRLAAAGVAFAAAALAKETYAAFALAAALYLVLERTPPLRRRLARAAWPLAPAAVALAAWWGYLLRVLPVDAHSGEALRTVTLPPAGWPHLFGLLLTGGYGPPAVPDAPGPAGPGFLLATVALLVGGLLVGLRRTHLPARVGLLLAGYATLLGRPGFGYFYSAMRVLAPCALAGLIAVAAEHRPPRPARRPARPAKVRAAAAPPRG